MRGRIVQRGQSFSVVLYLGRDPTTGKERRKWTTFRTRREAERYRTQAVAMHEAGGVIATTRQRLGDYLHIWLRGHTPHLAPTTAQSYRDLIQGHLLPALGHVWLAKLTPQLIRDYVDTALRTGLSTTSVRYHVVVLRAALSQAVRDGLLPRNAASLVTLPKRAHSEMRTLDLEQATVFLGEAKRYSPYCRLYLAALTTGARQGELAGLRWQDIDFSSIPIRAAIRQTMYRLAGRKRDQTKGQTLFGAPKGKRARTVPLAPTLVGKLLALRDEQKDRKRRLGDRYQDFDLVFCQPNGKPLHFHNVTQKDFRRVLALHGLRKELRKAGVTEEALPKGLPQIRFHDLRHSAASLWLAQGRHPKVVQELLGHQSATMTLDVYSHAIPALAEAAVTELADLLAPTRKQAEAKPAQTPVS